MQTFFRFQRASQDKYIELREQRFTGFSEFYDYSGPVYFYTPGGKTYESDVTRSGTILPRF